MTNPPTFTLAECSVRGYSLLQWVEPGSKTRNGLQSLQMPTEIAEYLAVSANARPALEALLDRVDLFNRGVAESVELRGLAAQARFDLGT